MAKLLPIVHIQINLKDKLLADLALTYIFKIFCAYKVPYMFNTVAARDSHSFGVASPVATEGSPISLSGLQTFHTEAFLVIRLF